MITKLSLGGALDEDVLVYLMGGYTQVLIREVFFSSAH